MKKPSVYLLLAGCLLLTGCVYLRLYSLKGQLSDFMEHFEVVQQDSGRPSLVFKDPLMKPGDIVWLTGLEPTHTQGTDEQATRFYYFDKLGPAPVQTGRHHRLMVTMAYTNDALHKMTFPSHYSSFLTQVNIREMFEPISDADIRRDQKQTEWTWQEMHIEIPTYEKLLHYLGPPTEETSSPEFRTVSYRYQLEKMDPESPYAPGWEMVFRVFQDDQRVSDVDALFGRFRVKINLAGEDKSVNLERK